MVEPGTGKPTLGKPTPENTTPILYKMNSLKGVSNKFDKPASPDIDKKKFQIWADEQNLFNPNIVDKHYLKACEGAKRWISENHDKAEALLEECVKNVMTRNP